MKGELFGSGIKGKSPDCKYNRDFRGGDKGIRTPDLLNANQALSRVTRLRTQKVFTKFNPHIRFLKRPRLY